MAEDLAKLQAPPEALAAAAAGAPPETVEVLPECWQAVEAFLLCQTQWRLAGMGSPIGLDYAGVQAALHLNGVAATTELFQDLRVMEHAAVEALAERRPG